MTIVNSRQSSVMPNGPEYITSEPRDSDWGQPSVSHYVLRIVEDRLVGELVGGVYVAAQPIEAMALDAVLNGEMSAWDSVSDEALHVFESGLE